MGNASSGEKAEPAKDNEMPVKFYAHKASAPCRSVLMTLNVLGVKFEPKEVDLAGGAQKADDYLAVNLRGKIPAIQDGDFSMGESRAILRYLCNKYDKKGDLYPKDAKTRARVDQLLDIDSDAMAAMFEYVKPFPVLVLNQKPGFGNEDDMKVHLDVFEKVLSKSKFLAGEKMTIADIAVAATLSILDMAEYDLGQFPKLAKWREGIKAHKRYEECIGQDSAFFTKLYQGKINA